MKIIEFQHVKPGKGGAFVRTKLKDTQSGKIIDETFNAGHKLDFIRVEAKPMQFLYTEGESHIFMDNEPFDQINTRCLAHVIRSGFKCESPNSNLLALEIFFTEVSDDFL